MKSIRKIALIGGTGKSGAYILRELLNQGFRVKLLLRNPEKAPSPHPQVELIFGTIEDSEALTRLLADTDATISALGIGNPPSTRDIFTSSTLKIIELSDKKKDYRYLVLSGLSVDTPEDQKGEYCRLATEYMYQNFPESTKNKQSEYELLSQSSLEWTMIRSSMIVLSDETPDYQVSNLDCKGQKISSSNLAKFIVGQLDSEEYIHHAPFIWD